MLEYHDQWNQWSEVGKLQIGRQNHAILSVGPQQVPCTSGEIFHEELKILVWYFICNPFLCSWNRDSLILIISLLKTNSLMGQHSPVNNIPITVCSLSGPLKPSQLGCEIYLSHKIVSCYNFEIFQSDCPVLPPSTGQLCVPPSGAQDCRYDGSTRNGGFIPDVVNCCCGRCDTDMTCDTDSTMGTGLWKSTNTPLCCSIEGQWW